MNADIILWFCPCSAEETEHYVDYEDGCITCSECLEAKPITTEIDDVIIGKVLEAQH